MLEDMTGLPYCQASTSLQAKLKISRSLALVLLGAAEGYGYYDYANAVGSVHAEFDDDSADGTYNLTYGD
jgi:hypothetical protein